jgi:hypothetical protein
MFERPQLVLAGLGAGRRCAAHQAHAFRASQGFGGRLGGVQAPGGRGPPPPQWDGRRRPEGGGGKQEVPAWLRRLIRAASVISGAATILFLLYQGSDPAMNAAIVATFGIPGTLLIGMLAILLIAVGAGD